MNNNASSDSNGGPVSVSTMAAWVNLSRDRFYDLVRSGVFPPPVYDLVTRRPRYTQELQQVCLRIKETGLGFDGRYIVFNRKLSKRQAAPPRPRSIKHAGGQHEMVRMWSARLCHLGIKAMPEDVAAALAKCCPQGTAAMKDDDILRHLCRRLRSRQ